MNKSKNGITLIALVVTIVVLLILAAVSISMLGGDNGILQKATTAKENTDNAQIKERIQLAELSAMAEGKGILKYSSLNNELTKEFGDKGTGYNISDEDEEIWIIKVGNVEYNINNTNIVQNPTEPTDEFAALRKKIAMESGDCMIDEDGNIMSIDIWNWQPRLNGECSIGCQDVDDDGLPVGSAYKSGEFLADGNLKYNIPVFIKSGDEIYKMTMIDYGSFYELTSLRKVKIPNSVKEIFDRAFEYCSNLSSITIPDSVTDIGYYTFSECTNITSITIQSSLKSKDNVGSAFAGWTSSQTINIHLKDGETQEDYEPGLLFQGCNAQINYLASN